MAKPRTSKGAPSTQPMPGGAMPYQPGPGLGPGNVSIKADTRGVSMSPPAARPVRMSAPKMSVPKVQRVSVRQPRKVRGK